MNKGLEALNYIVFNCRHYDNLDNHEEIVEKELKALIVLKDIAQLKVYKNKLCQCFLIGINILIPIDNEQYDLLKEVLL